MSYLSLRKCYGRRTFHMKNTTGTPTTSGAWTVYPSGVPEFIPPVFILQEYLSSSLRCLSFRSTWVHPSGVYPSGVPEFIPQVFILQEYLSSSLRCLSFRSTWVHRSAVYPSGVAEFIPLKDKHRRDELRYSWRINTGGMNSGTPEG
jgi:hypothetical protein